MRREGFELAVGRPQVIVHNKGDHKEEPYEQLTVDIEAIHQGAIMEKLGERRGDIKNIDPDGKGRVRLEYIIPARGLIGFRSEFLTLTSGTGLLYNVFNHYGPYVTASIGQRNNGVLISNSHNICFAHNKANLETILNAYEMSFSKISEILRKGNLIKNLRNSRIITPVIQVREQLQKE